MCPPQMSHGLSSGEFHERRDRHKRVILACCLAQDFRAEVAIMKRLKHPNVVGAASPDSCSIVLVHFCASVLDSYRVLIEHPWTPMHRSGCRSGSCFLV